MMTNASDCIMERFHISSDLQLFYTTEAAHKINNRHFKSLKGANKSSYIFSTGFIRISQRGNPRAKGSPPWHWLAKAPHSGLNHCFTCTCWSLWQPRRHCISLKSRLLWRQEVGIREWRGCHIRGSYQCVAGITELQRALIGRLDCDWHGEGLRCSGRLLPNGTKS